MSKGRTFHCFMLLLAVAISGCGYNGEQAFGSHQQAKVSETKLNVITGDVYSTGGQQPVSLSFNDQTVYTLTPSQRSGFSVLSNYLLVMNQAGFLDDNNDFYFHGATTDATLAATFADETLYSYFGGIPLPKASVTITQEWSWNGNSSLYLSVSKSVFSTVSINPFSNLAYWLKEKNPASYPSYGAARDKVNELLGLPSGCRFEEELCPSHLAKLHDGVEIHADATSYTIIRPGQQTCSGPITQFSDCPL